MKLFENLQLFKYLKIKGLKAIKIVKIIVLTVVFRIELKQVFNHKNEI